MEGKSPTLDRIISEQSSAAFERQKTRLILRALLISGLVIFCLETLDMLLIMHVLKVPEPYDLYIDGLLLVAVLIPINYFRIVRPLSRQVDNYHRMNQELRKSNELLERFFSVNDVLIAFMDADFNFIRVNKAYAEADQRDPAYFIGKNHFDLFPNEENRAIFERVVRTGEAYTISEKPFVYAANPERGVTYWDWSLLPVKDASGKVVQLLYVLSNVTLRKRAQVALSESERRFRAVFNQSFQYMALLDPAGSTLLLNQRVQDFSGLADSEAVGKPFWRLPWWGTEDPAGQLQPVVERAARGEVVQCELQMKPAAGGLAIMAASFKPLLDSQGHTSLVIFEAHDITERIHYEQALKQNEKEINRLYQAEMRAHERADILRQSVQALSGSLNSSDVVEILLDNVYRAAPFSSAHILLKEDEDRLVVRVARGEEAWDDRARLFGRTFDPSEYPFFHAVLVDRLTYAMPDTRCGGPELFFEDAPSVLSWLAIPLQAGDQVIGLCLLEHERAEFFTRDMVQWAVTMTGQAGVAIHNAWLFEQVRDNREHLQALSRRLVEAQESERQYIARELHDEAGQALASLMLGLRHLELDSGDQAAVIENCRELRQITDSVLEGLHRLSVNLRPATLDHLGLVAALRQHAETVSLQHGLAVQFESIGAIERLPGEMETAIYRIVQEGLTNIVRHACATRVDILLEHRGGDLVVVVEDNGTGFDPNEPKTNHLGILGMRERAEMLGGTVTIESTPGNGSTIILEVPCPSES